ncbi:hypothetical protein CapIbe_012313 [Capra ibex]
MDVVLHTADRGLLEASLVAQMVKHLPAMQKTWSINSDAINSEGYMKKDISRRSVLSSNQIFYWLKKLP